MAKITNKASTLLRLPAGHVIPANSSIEVANDAIRNDNWPTLSSLISSGDVEVEYDKDPEPGPESSSPGIKPKQKQTAEAATKEGST
jgi:hypothetical protein